MSHYCLKDINTEGWESCMDGYRGSGIWKAKAETRDIDQSHHQGGCSLQVVAVGLGGVL